MRVAIDARKIRDFGIGTYIRGLIGGLLEIGEDEIVALAPASDKLPDGVEHIISDAPKYSIRELLTVGRGLRADVFHAPHYVVPLTKLPTVVTIHDLIHLRLRNPIKRAYARTMMRRAVRHTVVTVSNAVKRDIEETLGAKNVLVTPNGVDAHFTPEGPRREGRYVLYVGNRRPYKNAGAAIEAAKRAGIDLVCAGEGFEYFDDLAPLYRGALALVMPSLAEGFGLPAAEAMASGIPVVMTSIPSYLSFDDTHDYALFAPQENAVELGEKLIELLSDADLRQRLREREREVAEQWRADRVAERIEKAVHAETRRSGG